MCYTELATTRSVYVYAVSIALPFHKIEWFVIFP